MYKKSKDYPYVSGHLLVNNAMFSELTVIKTRNVILECIYIFYGNSKWIEKLSDKM
jgi:hypothetical protein